MRFLSAPFVFFCVTMLMNHPVQAQSWATPPVPEVPPVVSETYSNDLDGDQIDDELQAFAEETNAMYLMAVTQAEKVKNETILSSMTDVELIFKEQITQAQIDAFLTLGGEIEYIYKAVSYGWQGRVPLRLIDVLPMLMEASGSDLSFFFLGLE